MEPNITSRPAFLVVGLRYFGDNQNQEITQLWPVFNRRVDEIKSVVPSGSYGLCIQVAGAKTGEFEYIAGVEVQAIDRLPDGMVARLVPARTYAVFPVRGGVEVIQETYQYAYAVWLPKSKYDVDGNLDFEYYGADFSGFSEDSLMFIYVPVKIK